MTSTEPKGQLEFELAEASRFMSDSLVAKSAAADVPTIQIS